MKWYNKLAIFLCVVVFSPIILAAVLFAGAMYLFKLPKNKKEYRESEYFKDLNIPYAGYLLYSPEYRFYNSAKKRKLPMDYIIQSSNGLEYFVFENVLYLFPDFEQIDFNEDDAVWEVDYDGEWKPFDEAYSGLLSRLDAEVGGGRVKLLVERKMFPMTDLNGIKLPESVFLTWNYEDAFQNEDSPLKPRIPTSTKELLGMMQQTPDLCGDYRLAENGSIVWDLYETAQISISIDTPDCCLEINKKTSGGVVVGITHWHPTIFEIYDEVRKIGRCGNVVLVRSFPFGAGVLYIGEKEHCPYNVGAKKPFGSVYYLEAKQQ